MSRARQNGEQARPGRRIVGPQSALTDFLASRNISAYEIEQNFRARQEAAARQLAEEQLQQEGRQASAGLPATAATPTGQETPAANGDSPASATPASGAVYGAEVAAPSPSPSGRRQLSAAQKSAVDKIKAGKKKKNKKRKVFGSDEDEDEDELTLALLKTFNTPLPGQMDNCAKCGKRFTVTPYSRADGAGKLLCTACGKLLDKDDDAAAKKRDKKKPRVVPAGPVGQRRKAQSRILDGASPVGAKPLVALCVEHLSRNIHLAHDLGDLPEEVIDRIARLLSKRRLVKPATVDLFIRPQADEICVYDCADLTEGDFLRMLQAMPHLKHMRLYNAIQFKDAVVDYLMQRDVQLETLCLYGANLISDAKWKEYLVERGQHLRTLYICDTDKHLTDDVVSYVKDCAPQLARLKLCGNQQVTGTGVGHIGHLKQLQHVSLGLEKPVHADAFVKLLVRVGAGLQTLSLRGAEGVDNAVLAAMHVNCRALRKLRITENVRCTDEGYARLFGGGWANPPLHVVDLEKNRLADPDLTTATANADGVGFCSKGFQALMAHSGSELRRLNIHACRHISREAFEAVFAEDKQYPELRHIDASFCGEVTDHIVCSMFRSCPKLLKVVTFGCMLVKGVEVPHGRIVVGVPNALGMQIVGHED